MSDINTIKERIRKLMAIAGDGVATDAEIDTALTLAAKLLDAHHLSKEDIGTAQDAEDMTMGRSAAVTTASWVSTWESTLAHAIVELFGCVKHYQSHEKQPIRKNGVAQLKNGKVAMGCKVYFYGPAMEAKEAAELFEEWSKAIAAMGMLRWGGCYMGDGGKYCYGFASALYAKARQINAARRLTDARPIPQLTGGSCTALTLTGRYDLLKTEAKRWLEKECGIHLTTRSASGGYRAGSSAAYSEGQAHGRAASFGRKTACRMLGSGC
jgi:hypothetical protein